MNETVSNKINKFNQTNFMKIVHLTMLVLFPITLVGAIAWTINMVILNPNGFLGSLIRIKLLNLWFIRAVIGDVNRATTQLLALYGAIVSAYITTKIYHKESLLAGIGAGASYVLIFFHTIRNSSVIDSSYYSGYWLIIGILIGYICGMIFVKFGKTINDRNDVLANGKPLLYVLTLAFILHIIYAVFRTYTLDTIIVENTSGFFNHHSSLALTLLISFISTCSLWLGFAGTLNFTSNISMNEAVINLNYVLNHKTVPYPFTISNLYNGFAQFGGVGASLALIIAILLIGKNKRMLKVTKWNLFPVFFNINLPFLMGIPIILNPIYLIPFILVPIINIVLAGIAMMLRILPAIVYPVATGTPGILVPFIGSGGNWGMLLFSLVLLAIDVLIYLPFVKLANESVVQDEKG